MVNSIFSIYDIDDEDKNENNSNGNGNSTTSLIPVLLSFLQRCPQNSSEQYLTLLVLNNLSIPMPNKRVIALQYDGVQILSRLLCKDPGCHLLAIIIVNLTFGDLELNRDILLMSSSGATTCSIAGSDDDGKSSSNGEQVQLVHTLGFILLVSKVYHVVCLFTSKSYNFMLNDLHHMLYVH